MDAKVVFWTAALLNLSVIIVLVVTGVRSIRRGQVDRHRRCMTTAGWLAVGFVGAYLVKLATLGREQLSVWSSADVLILRIHEMCVLTMLLGGAFALVRARQMRGSRNVTRQPSDALAPPAVASWHRRGGWTAVMGAAFGLATAVLVLAGMYRRAGLL